MYQQNVQYTPPPQYVVYGSLQPPVTAVGQPAVYQGQPEVRGYPVHNQVLQPQTIVMTARPVGPEQQSYTAVQGQPLPPTLWRSFSRGGSQNLRIMRGIFVLVAIGIFAVGVTQFIAHRGNSSS